MRFKGNKNVLRAHPQGEDSKHGPGQTKRKYCPELESGKSI